MKIGLKLGIGFAIAIAGLVVCVYLGINATNDVNSMLNKIAYDEYPLSVAMNNVDAAAGNISIATAMMYVNSAYPDRVALRQGQIKESILIIDSNFKAMNSKAPSSDEERKIISDIESQYNDVKAKLVTFVELFRTAQTTKDFEPLRKFRTFELGTALDTLANTLHSACNYVDNQVNQASIDSDVLYESVTKQLYIIAAVIVSIILVFSISLTIGITRPLRKAVDAANKVAGGDLSVDLATKSKDETAVLMQALAGMVSSIKHVIDDTKALASAATNGQLSVRADAKKHQGAYGELVASINGTLDVVVNPLQTTIGIINQISVGDLPEKVTATYPGDFNQIKISINGCIDAIGGLIHEANTLAMEVLNGNIHVKGDVSRHSGDYAKIIHGVNNLIEAFVEPIETVANFLVDVKNGNTEMKEVTKEYKGDFNLIKTNMNQLHGTLFGFLGGIQGLVVAAEAGNLDERIDSEKFQGGWHMIISGVNHMFNSFSGLINDAGSVISTMATGDLTPRITANYKGKFLEMKNDINSLGDSLTDLISQLQDAIHTTASASAQISATAETLATATQEQSSQTDEVASAVEEMSRTVTDNAHSATRTAEVAKHSGDMANDGGKVVNLTVSKMREIADVVKMSADNITKLGESSKKIGEIISVIDDIADQTNLLALNAAIEAARAGEQGRGFAVVADEVRKLAEGTAGATKQIADMIKGIQSDTDAAVIAMQKGTDEVQSGIDLADKAGMSLQDILGGINELLDMINQIAAASEEQSATSEQIAKNVSTISKVTADSARNVEDVAHTASELARMTDTLTELISQFKIMANGAGYMPARSARALN